MSKHCLAPVYTSRYSTGAMTKIMAHFRSNLTHLVESRDLFLLEAGIADNIFH